MQWRQIHLLSWKYTKEFWYEVLNFKNMFRENIFQDLATFAIFLLVLRYDATFSGSVKIKMTTQNRAARQTDRSPLYFTIIQLQLFTPLE